MADRDQERAADAVESVHPVAAPTAPDADRTRDAAPAAPEPVEPSAAPAVSAEHTAPPAAATMATVQDDKLDEYVSAVRGMTGTTPAAKRMIEAVAAFDETSRARLQQGLRLVEADVPTRYGAKLHEQFRDQLDPAVAKQLDLRFEKKKQRSAAFDEGARLTKLLSMAAKTATGEVPRLRAARDAANARVKQLEHEVAAGCYEDVDAAIDIWLDEHPGATVTAEGRDEYVQHGMAALDAAWEQAQRDRER